MMPGISLVGVLIVAAVALVVPVLADAGQSRSTLGQLIISAGAVILLSLFFSGDSSSVGSTLLLLGAFVALDAAIGITVAEVEHLGCLSTVLRNLQDSSAQIRVRGAFLFLIGFAVLAQLLGLEIILGAFIAGTVLRLVETNKALLRRSATR